MKTVSQSKLIAKYVCMFHHEYNILRYNITFIFTNTKPHTFRISFKESQNSKHTLEVKFQLLHKSLFNLKTISATKQ